MNAMYMTVYLWNISALAQGIYEAVDHSYIVSVFPLYFSMNLPMADKTKLIFLKLQTKNNPIIELSRQMQ